MKLIRFGERGQEQPGIIADDGSRRDCSAHFKDWNTDFFRTGGIERLRAIAIDSLPRIADSQRWGSCVARPGKVVCIGLNYRDHATETGATVPSEPILFMKAANTVVGPYDQVQIPRGSLKTDWEVELGVVIGRDARYLDSIADAATHIAGYCISNDVSERAFQLERGGQWTKGKSCDTFNPLGPWLATPEEIADVQNLDMSLDVNGVRKQTGNTRTMVFDVCHIVWYVSQFMTLEAGDLISTGTPPGVGMARKPPQFLKAGDVMTLTINGLGSQRQECIPWDAPWGGRALARPS